MYFTHLVASLGVAASRGFDVCYVATPRRAKMALGILAQMSRVPAARGGGGGGGGLCGSWRGSRESDGSGASAPTTPTAAARRLVPVEYNQIQPLLAATVGALAASNGDINLPSGYSAYPGNTNGILLALAPYLAALRDCEGVVTEFVNPKYVDEDTRDAFKAPTRLECLMQDIAWMYAPSVPVGYVCYPPVYGYFPCKNDIATAKALCAKGVPPYAAATSEMAVYNAHAAMLRAAGCAGVPLPVERSFHGVDCHLGPAVVLHASFAPCLSVLRARLPTPHAVSISARSTLLVKGRGVTIEGLQLDGALELSCCDAATLRVVSLAVSNDGWQFDELSPAVQARPLSHTPVDPSLPSSLAPVSPSLALSS